MGLPGSSCLWILGTLVGRMDWVTIRLEEEIGRDEICDCTGGHCCIEPDRHRVSGATV